MWMEVAVVGTMKLTIKILPAYKQAIDKLAGEEKEPVAVVIRNLIKEEARRRGVWLASPQGQGATGADHE